MPTTLDETCNMLLYFFQLAQNAEGEYLVLDAEDRQTLMAAIQDTVLRFWSYDVTKPYGVGNGYVASPE